MDHQTKPHESVIKAKENMETATEVSWLDLKTFAVWSVSTARIYGCRNVAKPAPVLWARQVSRLFDVVIVGTGAGPLRNNRYLTPCRTPELSIVHCLSFGNEVCG